MKGVSTKLPPQVLSRNMMKAKMSARLIDKGDEEAVSMKDPLLKFSPETT